MLWRMNSCRGTKVSDANGDAIGMIEDLFADREFWKIRYLAVAGGWPGARKALIAPASVTEAAWDRRELRVAVSREKIAHAPRAPEGLSVPRASDEALSGYYGWPAYWKEVPPPPGSYTEDSGGVTTRIAARVHPVALSLGQMAGWSLAASDGEAGRLEDALFDGNTWQLRYFIVNVGPTALERRALVAPRWITDLREQEREIHVNLAESLITNSPEFEPGMTVDRDFERRLCEHYGLPPNWC